MRTVLISALLGAASFVAAAQTSPPPQTETPATPVVNPDRNLEAARSYSPSPALEAAQRSTVRAPSALGRVNGSASRDWSLRQIA